MVGAQWAAKGERAHSNHTCRPVAVSREGTGGCVRVLVAALLGRCGSVALGDIQFTFSITLGKGMVTVMPASHGRWRDDRPWEDGGAFKVFSDSA